jgi:hypothetical protein
MENFFLVKPVSVEVFSYILFEMHIFMQDRSACFSTSDVRYNVLYQIYMVKFPVLNIL